MALRFARKPVIVEKVVSSVIESRHFQSASARCCLLLKGASLNNKKICSNTSRELCSRKNKVSSTSEGCSKCSSEITQCRSSGRRCTRSDSNSIPEVSRSTLDSRTRNTTSTNRYGLCTLLENNNNGFLWKNENRDCEGGPHSVSGLLLFFERNAAAVNTQFRSTPVSNACYFSSSSSQSSTGSSQDVLSSDNTSSGSSQDLKGSCSNSDSSSSSSRNSGAEALKEGIDSEPVVKSNNSAFAAERAEKTQEEEQQSSEEERHVFKAETQKLLHIVTHSLYTDKEVFIRELISNAADALEKIRFLQATAQVRSGEDIPLRITLSGDPKQNTFTIEDTGVGLTKQELLDHLGTIAKSGSLEFLMKHHSEKNTDIIGQFGVGFYSTFVVSERVEVSTRATNGKALLWTSEGLGDFTIKELVATAAAAVPTRGTKIVCHLKPDCCEFANFHTLLACAKKFSSFVNFPIYAVGDDGKEVTVTAQEALWLKPNPTEEEHKHFYRYLSNQSWGQPMYAISFRADAPLSIKALFYIPEDPPSRLFQTSNEGGVALHSRRVLVKRTATEIIPKWLSFLKGVVDCDDMPLNVSRENMQNSALVARLSQILLKRILRFLEDEAKADPQKYLDFYMKYGQHLKEGVLDDAHQGGLYKENLLKLLRFQCSESEEGEMISLEKYLEMVKPEQQNIYVYCCPGRETALASPYMEQFREKKRPVLLLTDDIDEFVTMNVQSFKGKKFVAIDSPEEDFEPLLEEKPSSAEDEKTKVAGLVGSQRIELERFFQSTLGSRVTAVKFSDRLLKTPAVVTGFLSSSLRKMMKATLQGAPDAQLKMASLPVTLELNPHHQLISSLYHLMQTNPDIAKLLVEQLYDNARVAAGIMEDSRGMLGRLNYLLEVTAQYAYHHSKAECSSAAVAASEREGNLLDAEREGSSPDVAVKEEGVKPPATAAEDTNVFAGSPTRTNVLAASAVAQPVDEGDMKEIGAVSASAKLVSNNENAEETEPFGGEKPMCLEVKDEEHGENKETTKKVELKV